MVEQCVHINQHMSLYLSGIMKVMFSKEHNSMTRSRRSVDHLKSVLMWMKTDST